MITFHHLDLDGHCAAALVKYFNQESRLYEVNYNRDLNKAIDQVELNEKVYIVDFSFPTEYMDRLKSLTKNIVWLDHHKSKIDDNPEIDGIRDTRYSGCELTWMWFCNYEGRNEGKGRASSRVLFETDKIIPDIVKYIGDMDTWQFKYSESENIYLGLGLYDTSPEHIELWADLLMNKDNILQSLKNQGITIKTYKQMSSMKMLESWSFERTFEGYKCLLLNKSQAGTKTFESADSNKYDIFVSFIYDGENVSVSLYSTNVDVSILAKKHGGGGHEGASGMTLSIEKFKELFK